MDEKELRDALIENCFALERLNIIQAMAGNLSARSGEFMLITPTGIPYEKMTPAMIARMPIQTDYGSWSGPLAPSSEWRMHLDIMRTRPDVGAVVHTHAIHATALSILHKPIPAVHYMIAAFGGPTIRCTKYAPFGTKELSDLALEGLADRNGVLLGQHGMLATGRDLPQATWRAVELEALARIYVLALGIGHPAILPDDEVMRIVERFKSYGYQPKKLAAISAGRTGKSPVGKPPTRKKAKARRR